MGDVDVLERHGAAKADLSRDHTASWAVQPLLKTKCNLSSR
jgi:hypothetical protein